MFFVICAVKNVSSNLCQSSVVEYVAIQFLVKDKELNKNINFGLPILRVSPKSSKK